MLDMDVVGWIVVGFIAGAISGALLGGSTARGCLPNILVGHPRRGASVAGWRPAMGFTQVSGFIAAIVVAVLGSLVVRLVLSRTRWRGPLRWPGTSIRA